MSNALVPYSEIEKMATAVAKSGLFGVKTPDQALALMLVAQAEGRHPALAARDYDIIQGRPSKKSEAMLRDFLESGGKVEWHALDDTCADATFSHPSGGSVRIEWTMKRAAAAGLGGKDMWRKYPRQMLRARAVSEGIRTVCPMATSGMYVPEEVQDFAKEKDITPTAGVADGVSHERREQIQAIADQMHEHLKSGAVDDAFLTYENADLDGAEEKTFLWTFFDSKQRSAMKKAAAAMKEAKKRKEEATDAEVVEEKPAVISDAQRKRLEAMISERGLDRDEIKEYCSYQYGKPHFKDLTPQEYDAVCSHIESGDTESATQQPADPSSVAGNPPAVLADTTTAAGQVVTVKAQADAAESRLSGETKLDSAPATAATNIRQLIIEGLAFASSALTARYEVKLMGRKLDQLTDDQAKKVYEWLQKELDK